MNAHCVMNVLAAFNSCTVLWSTTGGVRAVCACEGVDAIDCVQTAAAKVLNNSCSVGSSEPT